LNGKLPEFIKRFINLDYGRRKLKILAIQMSSIIGDKRENFAKIADLIEKKHKKRH